MAWLNPQDYSPICRPIGLKSFLANGMNDWKELTDIGKFFQSRPQASRILSVPSLCVWRDEHLQRHAPSTIYELTECSELLREKPP